MIASFTRVSSNTKTGPIPTTITEQASCPDTCPYKKQKLCYPYFSPLGFMWESLDREGFYKKSHAKRRVVPCTWDELCSKIKKLPKNQLWRHNVAGDLPGKENTIDLQKLNSLVKASKGKRGFTYTHKPVGYSGQPLINAQAIYAANKNGFAINLSADSLREADKLANMRIGGVVVVVPTDADLKMKTPEGRSVITCPAEISDVQCLECQLCAKNRKSIVAFHAHGTRKKKVNKLLKVIQ